jgi:hypothetical protein
MPENIHLQLLLATFAGWVGRRQTAVIDYLGGCKFKSGNVTE